MKPRPRHPADFSRKTLRPRRPADFPRDQSEQVAVRLNSVLTLLQLGWVLTLVGTLLSVDTSWNSGECRHQLGWVRSGVIVIHYNNRRLLRNNNVRRRLLHSISDFPLTITSVPISSLWTLASVFDISFFVLTPHVLGSSSSCYPYKSDFPSPTWRYSFLTCAHSCSVHGVLFSLVSVFSFKSER